MSVSEYCRIQWGDRVLDMSLPERAQAMHIVMSAMECGRFDVVQPFLHGDGFTINFMDAAPDTIRAFIQKHSHV